LKVLTTLEPVDHVICDPPYEDEFHKAIGRIRRGDGVEMRASLGFEGINAVRSKVSSLIVKVSRGWVLLFSLAEGVRAWRDDLQAAGAKYDTCLVWVKPDASPRFNGQGAARGFESIITAWCGRGYRSWNGGGKRGVYTHNVNPPTRDHRHPTEKPLALMEALVRDFTNPGQVILDPFMGGGSTGVACVKLGRRFVGIEQDPKHFDVACERITKALSQGDLFVERPAAKQEALPL
jgi:site-specific DNA-methyltransferase (adenine-specific)